MSRRPTAVQATELISSTCHRLNRLNIHFSVINLSVRIARRLRLMNRKIDDRKMGRKRGAHPQQRGQVSLGKRDLQKRPRRLYRPGKIL
jgi:hypothetical protein